MGLTVVACSGQETATEPPEPEEEPSEEGGSDYASLEPVQLIGADNAGVGAAAQLFGGN